MESRIQQGKHKALKLVCFGFPGEEDFGEHPVIFAAAFIYLFISSHVERDALRQTSVLSGSINSLESRRAAARCINCSLACAL